MQCLGARILLESTLDMCSTVLLNFPIVLPYVYIHFMHSSINMWLWQMWTCIGATDPSLCLCAIKSSRLTSEQWPFPQSDHLQCYSHSWVNFPVMGYVTVKTKGLLETSYFIAVLYVEVILIGLWQDCTSETLFIACVKLFKHYQLSCIWIICMLGKSNM